MNKLTMKTNQSYKVEVIADNSGEWCSNGQRYATEAEARTAGKSLAGRWTAVREMRVTPSEDMINAGTAVNAAQVLELGR